MDEEKELQAIRARLLADVEAAAVRRPALTEPLHADDATLPRLVEEHLFLVVDVWAPWCGPCRIVGPIIDDLAREMSGRVTFAKLNADENPTTMQGFGIQGIPTLLVFREGRLVDRIVGALPKPALQQRLTRLEVGRSRGTPGPRR